VILMPDRRFRPPWIVVERPECFRVDDADGKALGYFYFLPERLLSSDHKALSKDEARRLAANFSKLPDLLTKLSDRIRDEGH
jgi:hypothetical protein